MTVKAHKTVACLLIPLLFYSLFLLSNPLYLSTDSMEVAEVVDGLYGENNFCQFLHPLLCVIIKPLNTLFPVTDIFTTLVHLAILFSLSLLLWYGFESVDGVSLRNWPIEDGLIIALTLLSTAFFSAGMVIWNANYNVQTAFFVFFGFLTLSISHKRGKKGIWYVFGALFVAFGFMLRIEAALLFLPFIALEIITEFIEKKKFSSSYMLPAILIIAVLFSSRIVFYRIEPYKSAIEYNVARTACMDYPMKNWEQIADEANMIEADYHAVTDWVLADTELITTEMMSHAAAVGGRNEYSCSDGVAAVLTKMWQRLTQTNLYMFAMFIMTIVLMVRNLIVCVKWRKLESVLAVAGGFIILFYYTVRGRAPLRVWEPVMFAADYVLISAAVSSSGKDRIKTVDLLFQIILCMGLWFSAGQVIAHNEWKKPATTLNAKVGADETVFREAFDPDGYYLWPNWFTSIPWYYSDRDKLPPRWVLEHNLPVGDWTYGQPYFEEFLKENGMENPAKALVERDDVYVMDNGDTLYEFLKAHYGDDLVLEEAGELNGKIAYRVLHERAD